MTIYCNLLSILGNKRIKMTELARAPGMSKTTIHAMYHDRVQKIDYNVLDRICKGLACSVADLIEYVEDDEK